MPFSSSAFLIFHRRSVLTSHQFRAGAQIYTVRLTPLSPRLSTKTEGEGFLSANGWVSMTSFAIRIARSASSWYRMLIRYSNRRATLWT